MEEFVDGEKKMDRGAAEAKQLWRGTRGRRTEALIFALWRGNAIVSNRSNHIIPLVPKWTLTGGSKETVRGERGLDGSSSCRLHLQ